MAAAYPEIGQQVLVRNRSWIVSDSKVNALTDRPQRLVELLSVEDDARGETIQVVWDLEPGAELIDAKGLPPIATFDPPERLDAFLDAVRWGSIASADVKRLQSPFRAGIAIEDYQLAPVNRALTMPRVNLLIADDVGLGKTIEAGLVMLELILRHRARTILVVCPPSLQLQWRDQMLQKFGLEFRIVDRELIRQLRRARGIHANPWTHFPRLITSIDFLKRDGPMNLMQAALPAANESQYPRRFDLLIVDEAHNIAPSGSSTDKSAYSRASDRTRAIRALTPHFEHKLFLTATPHNGFTSSFTALLELLDDQRFSRAIQPDQKQLDTVMIRRLKRDIRSFDGIPRFAERRVESLAVDYDDSERCAHRRLQEYGQSRLARAADDPLAQTSVGFVVKTLKKRLFSSPAAFARTISQHLHSVDTPQLKVDVRPAVTDLRARFERANEPIESDLEADEITEDAFDDAERFSQINDTERAMLLDLAAWADKAMAKPDRKAEVLLAWLDHHVRMKDERVIIFTEYRDTQKWLYDTVLAPAGYTRNNRTRLIYGGLDKEERERIKAEFQADPATSPVRILLATDAASEGLDFQNHCHQVIHYEIPWNPNRLEQRNGRVDRHGQSSPEVLIYHFMSSRFDTMRGVGASSLDDDLEFLWRAAKKVNQIREDIGSAGTVLATQVEQAMLGGVPSFKDLDAVHGDAAIRKALSTSTNPDSEIRNALETMRATQQELHLEPARVQRAVSIALELAEQPALRKGTLDGETVWFVPPLAGSWERTRDGLHHPFTGQARPIVFDHDVADRLGDQVVLAHLLHPLVDRCMRLLREAMWGSKIPLNRMAIHVVSDRDLTTPAVIAHGRMVVAGGDGERLHEQLIEAGLSIHEGTYDRLGVREVESALALSRIDVPVPEALEARLAALWETARPRLQTALAARARERSVALEREVRQREAQEIAEIAAILDELERTIRRELDQPEVLQLSFMLDADDRAEVERDRAVLQERLKQVPAEREREIAAIRTRYERTEPHLFPVAVTWLVPQSVVRSVQR